MEKKLFEHKIDSRKPKNINEIHRHEQEAEGLNRKIAVFLTKNVGTMWMAYAFTILAATTIFAVLGFFGRISPLVAAIGAAMSQTFIQLVLLPVIMVGQNVLNRKTEIQADEDFKVNQKSFHDIEQIVQHLDMQDQELLKQSAMLSSLIQSAKDKQP